MWESVLAGAYRSPARSPASRSAATWIWSTSTAASWTSRRSSKKPSAPRASQKLQLTIYTLITPGASEPVPHRYHGEDQDTAASAAEVQRDEVGCALRGNDCLPRCRRRRARGAILLAANRCSATARNAPTGGRARKSSAGRCRGRRNNRHATEQVQRLWGARTRRPPYRLCAVAGGRERQLRAARGKPGPGQPFS